MGAGGGAVAAAVAAAHQRRIHDILDAYRTAPATSSERARAPEELQLTAHKHELRELLKANVLVPGAQPGTYYLDERSYITYRNRLQQRSAIVILVVVALVIALLIYVSYMKGNR
jgi:hypothetical protein